MGGRAELEAFTSGIEVNVVEQVKPVKMPTANVAMLAQYFLKSGAQQAAETQLALKLPPADAGDVKAVTSLSESHAEMLRAALQDLGDARKILDPALPR